MQELVETEQRYVKQLEQFTNSFYNNLEKHVKPERLKLIFPAVVVDILSIHQKL